MKQLDLKILVIVPAYNEAGQISRVCRDIAAQFPSARVVVIDDGSLDDTYEQAKSSGAAVVRLPFNLGIGGAVQTGFQYARRYDYDIAVQIDGDGQHDPAYLQRVIEPVMKGQADMAIGSRFLDDSGGFKSTFSRRIGIRFFVHLINVLTGIRVTDPTSGFRAHNKRLIEAFATEYPHDFPEPEAVVMARRMGAVIREVPVVMKPRQGGNSSIRRFKSAYYMLKVTVAICLGMLRRPTEMRS